MNGKRRRCTSFFLVTIISLFIAGSSLARTTTEAGIWEKRGEFGHINVVCSQLWECRNSSDLLTGDNCKITFTSDKASKGTCAQDGSDPESCTNCVGAAEPSIPCAVTITFEIELWPCQYRIKCTVAGCRNLARVRRAERVVQQGRSCDCRSGIGERHSGSRHAGVELSHNRSAN
jgi:hypothetical protein